MATYTYVRANAFAGAIDVAGGANALGAGTTLLTSAGLVGNIGGAGQNPPPATLTGNQAIRITFFVQDATTRAITKREDCLIIAYTSGAGTATILRGQNDTTAQSWAEGSLWVAGWAKEDNAIGFIGNGFPTVASFSGALSAYNNGTAYTVGQGCTSGGVSYLCIANTTGNAPPNATYWLVLTTVDTTGTINGVIGKCLGVYAEQAVTIVQPAVADAGSMWGVQRMDANSPTYAMNMGAVTIDGAVQAWDVQWSSMTFVSDGVKWHVYFSNNALVASAQIETLIRANMPSQMAASSTPIPVTSGGLATKGALHVATMVNLAEFNGLALAVSAANGNIQTATTAKVTLRTLKDLGFAADVSVTFTTPNDSGWDGTIMVELEADVAGDATYNGVWGLLDLNRASVVVSANGQNKHGGGTTTGLLTTASYDNIELSGGGLPLAVAGNQFFTITDGTNSEHISSHGANAAGATNPSIQTTLASQPWTPAFNYTAGVTLAAVWGRMPRASVIGQTAVARSRTFIYLTGLVYNTTYAFAWAAAVTNAAGTFKTYANLNNNVPSSSATPYGPMLMRASVGV